MSRVGLALACTVALAAVDSLEGFPSFAANVPNGASVRDCDGVVWTAVGHENRDAGGLPLNAFGVDLQANGLSWAAVCALDSDGDGMTNGEELGDPDCTWTPEQGSEGLLEPLSHPGLVCQQAEEEEEGDAEEGGSDEVEEEDVEEEEEEADGNGAENPRGSARRSPAMQVWIHGILMISAWFVCAPIGVILAVMNKTKVEPSVTNWFKLHQAFLTMTALLTIIAFAIILLVDFDGFNFNRNWHTRIGYAVVLGSILQLVIGMLRPNKNQPKQCVRSAWEYFHQWFGRVLLLLALAASCLGIMLVGTQLGDETFTINIVYTLLAAFVLLFCVYFIYVACIRVNELSQEEQKPSMFEFDKPTLQGTSYNRHNKTGEWEEVPIAEVVKSTLTYV